MRFRFDMTTTAWRKSSYSNSDGGSCLEVADEHVGVLPVRDSKNPSGPSLLFTAHDWSNFVDAVKSGDLSA